MTKRRAPKKAAKPKAKVDLPALRRPAIGDLALGFALSRSTGTLVPVDIFAPAKHPPSVTPSKESGLAMDSAMTGNALAWAQSAVGASAISNGLVFLGYPLLSELAQRAEYRAIVETISTEMTREWIEFTYSGEGDASDKIKALEAEMIRLNARTAFRKMAENDGFFGRSHLFLDFDAGIEPADRELQTPVGDGDDEMSGAKVSKEKKLARIKPVEPVWCYPANYNSSNPLAPDWYKPAMWVVQGTNIHASRLLTFVGREVPDMLKPAYSFGGLSMSQMAQPYVNNWLRTRQSVADIIHSFSVMVLSTNLATMLAPDAGDSLQRRMATFNGLRDNRGLMAVDKDTEDLVNVAAPLGSLDALQAQTQEHMAAVSKIPIVKLLGIQPLGLNADSEGIMRTFYDSINAFQEHLFRPNLTRLIKFAQLSLFGAVDPGIGFEFKPLWSLDAKSEAEVEKVKAETDGQNIQNGVLWPGEARKRIASDRASDYHGLDANDVPEVAEPVDADPEPDEPGGATVEQPEAGEAE